MRSFGVIFCLLLVSCSAYSQLYDFELRQDFKKTPKALVWDAVTTYLESQQVDIRYTKRDSGVIYAERDFYMHDMPRYANCDWAQFHRSEAAWIYFK